MFLIVLATNPLCIFLAVWGAVSALYAGGVSVGLFPFPHPLTVRVLLLNGIAFPLGYLTWTLVKGLMPQDEDQPAFLSWPATSGRIQGGLMIAFLAGAAAAGLMLYRASLIADQYSMTVADLFARPVLLRFGLVLFVEASLSHSSLIVQMIAATSALFTVGFVLLGAFLYIDRTAMKYAYLCVFLVMGLAICLMNLSRYDMTVYVLYVILSYGVVCVSAGERRFRRVVKDLLLPVLTIVLIFTVVELLLRKRGAYGRTTTIQGVLYSFYWYLASPTAALNEFLADFQGSLGLGQNTFLPFWKWLSRFGVLPEPWVSAYGEYVFIPYPANVYTYLRPFYEDFGIWGVAVLPYLLGGLLAALRGPAGRQIPCLYLYVSLLVPILLSFFSYPIVSSQFYMQIVFAFLLFRYDLRGARGVDPATLPQYAMGAGA